MDDQNTNVSSGSQNVSSTTPFDELNAVPATNDYNSIQPVTPEMNPAMHSDAGTPVVDTPPVPPQAPEQVVVSQTAPVDTTLPAESVPTPPVMETPQVVEQPVVDTPTPVMETPVVPQAEPPVMETPVVPQPVIDTQATTPEVPAPVAQEVTVDNSLDHVTPPPIEEPTVGESPVVQEATNVQPESMDLIPPQPVDAQAQPATLYLLHRVQIL